MACLHINACLIFYKAILAIQKTLPAPNAAIMALAVGLVPAGQVVDQVAKAVGLVLADQVGALLVV